MTVRPIIAGNVKEPVNVRRTGKNREESLRRRFAIFPRVRRTTAGNASAKQLAAEFGKAMNVYDVSLGDR